MSEHGDTSVSQNESSEAQQELSFVESADKALEALETLLAVSEDKKLIEPPDPGVYYDVSFDAYLQWAAMSASAIDWGLVSMEHLKGYVDGVLRKESQALDFGRAIHCKLLEPEHFDERFTVAKSCEAILKSGENKGKACGCTGTGVSDGKWLCGKHLPDFSPPLSKQILTPQEHAACQAIFIKIKAHPVVKMLRSQGGCETTLSWKWNGLACKSRMDKLIHADKKFPRTVVDVKKVSLGKCTTAECERSIGNYHYDVKAAFYCDAAQYVFDEPAEFIWVFVEDSFPYSINVIHCDAETLQIGREKYQGVLFDWLKCLENGRYPGVSYDFGVGHDIVRQGGLPDYARNNWRKSQGQR